MENLHKLDEEWEKGQKLNLCKGERETYLPWINIRSFHSQTARFRIPSVKLNRTIHLMSYGERCAFLLFEWDDRVRDIKEQYALEPRMTREICEQFNYRHPGYTFGGQVMTSDLLVSRWTDRGTIRLTAVQVKHAREEIDKRTQEKIEIEREYWRRKGAEFELMITDELNQTLCSNLLRLYRFRQMTFSKLELRFMLNSVSRMRLNPELPFSCLPHEMLPVLQPGVQYSLHEVFKILCAHKVLSFPMEKLLLAECRVGHFMEVKGNV